jgi:hypothetical protein
MGHYEIGLKWNNVDGTECYVENVQIYETEQNPSDEQNGSEVGNNILEKTEEASDEISKNAKKAVDKIEDLD